jgi:nicotinamide phosphoribosyltransferase
MSLLTPNFILLADSYKVNHFSQIPQGVKWVQSSIVPRKPSKFVSKIVAAGIQYLALYLASVRITMADIEEAEIETREQGYEFNREGWERIVRECDGRLPLRVTAVREGTPLNPNTAMVMIENTVDWAAWLPSYSETVAQCIIWKVSTVASISREIYHTLRKYAEKTGSPVEMAEYGLHNFGDRGADSIEASAWSGLGHAFVFSGSDSLKTNLNIKRLYGTTKAYMSSVEATEHSTMCMNSDAANRNDYGAAVMAVERLEAVVARTKERGIGIPLMSVVIDTYDDKRFVRDFLGSPELKERIKNSGGKLVLRPDSGDPLTNPIEILNLAGEVFGFTINEQGYKVLPPYVGVLQGDGINQESLVQILDNVLAAGWASGNIVFGMGGGLTHEAGRDEFSFSQKATGMSLENDPLNVAAWIDMKKEPITDRKKSSHSGYLVNVVENGEVVTRNRKELQGLDYVNANTTVFENGVAFVDDVNFDEVRSLARS